MAGLGRKVFTRERATVGDVQGYLMDQAVMVFANSSQRGVAIATPSAGMVTYLTSVGRYDEFDGTGWVPLINGARGEIASANLSGQSGNTPNNYELGTTNAATVRAGERTRITANLGLYAGAAAQAVVLTIARTGVGGRVGLATRTVGLGGAFPNDGATISFSFAETPPAGTYTWHLEAASSIGPTGMAYVAFGTANLSVEVVSRS